MSDPKRPTSKSQATAESAPESALEFPCRFPIKIVGKAMGEAGEDQGESFEALVVTVVRRHAPDLGEGAVARRASREGRYLSLTVTVNATSREQLDAIYHALTALDEVLMAL